MAELAIASGIAGLCSLVIESVKICCAFGADIASAERTTLDYLAALRSLEAVLIELNSYPRTPKITALLGQRPDVLSESTIQECKTRVFKLHQKLSNRLNDEGKIKLRSALCWPFSKQKTAEATQILQQYRDTFHAALTSDIMKVSVAVYAEIRESNEHAEKQAILSWLFPQDLQLQIENILRSRQPTTCDWIFELGQFKSWVTGSGKRLWVYGAPGVGKTFLAAATVDRLKKSGACCFYLCDQQAAHLQQPELILRSLLKQAVHNLTTVPLGLLNLYKEQKDASNASSPTTGQLMSIFEGLYRESSGIRIVLDGLDECDDRRQISQLLRLLCDAGASVLVTSRKMPDIERLLRDWDRIEYKASEADLKSYIDQRFDDLAEDMDDDLPLDLRQLLSSKILNKCNGIFLLCRLIMEDLKSSVNIAQMRRCAEALPSNLGEMYQKTIDRLSAPGLKNTPRAVIAIQTLSWIAFCARPLHVNELRHALATENHTHEMNHENITSAKTIVSSCFGLIEVDNESQCRFVHLTAYEFFRNHFDTDQVNLDISRTCVTYLGFKTFAREACQDQISMEKRMIDYPFAGYSVQFLGHHAQACEEEIADDLFTILHNSISVTSFSQLWYFRDRKDQTLKTQAFESMPTGRSALQFACGAGMIKTLQLLLDAGADIAYADAQGWSALHSAASYGQSRAVSVLLKRQAHIEQPDLHGWTPLFWSAFKGHQEATKVLLAHGASTSATDISGWSPVHWAACKGDDQILTLLSPNLGLGPQEFTYARRENWADYLQQKFQPAFIAAERDNAAAFDAIVVQSNSQVDGTMLERFNRRSPNALKTKQSLTRMAIVEKALGKAFHSYSHARDPTAQSIAFPSSFLMQLLDAAIRVNHLNMVRMILDRGLDLRREVYDELKGRSILHTAAFCLDSRIPSLLLQNGACATKRDKSDYFPVDLAARNASEPVLRVFMNHRTVIDTIPDSEALMFFIWQNTDLNKVNAASDDTGMVDVPSKSTLESRKVELASELSRLGARANIRDDAGNTPLHFAVQYGIAAVDFLTRVGADINDANYFGQTPLLSAISAIGKKGDDLCVISRLLSLGAKVDVKDTHGSTPLKEAVKFQQSARVISALIAGGADANVPDKFGQTALLEAARNHDTATMKLLINSAGAKTHIRSKSGANCLHTAGEYWGNCTMNSGEKAAFVRFVADLCPSQAPVERRQQNHDDGREFPFEVAMPYYNDHDYVVPRVLFHLALEADRPLIEDFLGDDSLWTQGQDEMALRTARILSYRSKYQSWRDEIDRGEFDPTKDAAAPMEKTS